MAKQNKASKPFPQLTQSKTAVREKKTPSGATRLSTHFLLISCALIITWLVLGNALNNQFTWDDSEYIQNNLLIRKLSWNSILAIFSNPVMGNYHPLTILSYAFDYHLAETDPWQYHFTNLAIHLCNVVWVYWFTYLLTKKPVAGFITSLLFAIHPMHIESVAWASGRKDVLYVFFFICSCICYVYYLRGDEKQRVRWYLLVLLFFVCSLLSKPVAVTLPLVMLLLDYFENRTWSIRLIIEKIPHFLLSFFFGILSILVQHHAGAMDMEKENFNILERVALGCYALLTYLWKTLLPAGLCNLYAYPQKVNGHLPFGFYVYPLVVAGLVYICWKYLRKSKMIVFGLLFFVINIVLVLQFIPVGDSIVADRYSYLPYLGFFIIAGWYFAKLTSVTTRLYMRVGVGASAIYLICLGYAGNSRVKVWYDPASLWTDAIRKDPLHSPGAYDNLGYFYYEKWASTADPPDKKRYYDSTLLLLNKAIELWPSFINPYLIIGEMERNAGKQAEARQNYLRAMKYDDHNPNLTLGMAIIYFAAKNNDSAKYWFRRATIIHPSPESFGNFGNFLSLSGNPDSALVAYTNAIKAGPGLYGYRMNRGDVYMSLNQLDSARADFDAAIRLNPDAGDVYYERSLCYHRKGDNTKALNDVEKAISLGYNKVSKVFYDSLKR